MKAEPTLFETAGTAAVSDALDVLGVEGGLAGLRHVSGSCPVAGPAHTIRIEPVSDGVPASAADYIDDVPSGAVVVIANGGRTDCTVWGDILSVVATSRGVRASVIDGACRDVDGSRRADYPIWARATYMKSGKNRVRMSATQVPIEMAGVLVSPGDVVCADASGVVVVPAGLVDEAAQLVTEIVAMEERVLNSVRGGLPLWRAREKHGYNRFARRLGEAQAPGSSSARGSGGHPVSSDRGRRRDQ